MERNGSILAQLTKENKKRSSESSIMQHTCQRSDIHCRGLITQVMRYLLFSEGGVLSAHALTLIQYSQRGSRIPRDSTQDLARCDRYTAFPPRGNNSLPVPIAD
uniref:Uncharacterized protein LOC111132950 isoform X2 n=1 Tax=Crassostrea virginica TaxID=6565 RepID=A0A8B8EAM1_CRAVI|nr:uncharacterized protein LOC111132950 isoform X2 [Crassostrea virginica]